LPKLAKAPNDSISKVVGEFTTYSIPYYGNLTETMRLKEDYRFYQNLKKLRM
jgi:hypothetical protein